VKSQKVAYRLIQTAELQGGDMNLSAGFKSLNPWKIIYPLVALLVFIPLIFSAIPATAATWNAFVRVDENVTYRPYVDGTITGDWTAVGRAERWDCVDEDPDANGNYNDNDYVLGEGTNNENALLLFNRYGALYSPEGMRGVDVTVYYRVRDNASALFPGNNTQAVLQVGGVNYFGASENPPWASMGFETFSHTWTVNPATGQEWTWNDLWAGAQFGVYSDDLQPSIRVSAVWMVMKYDLVAPFATLDFAAASYQETDGAEKSIGVRLSNATTNTVTVNYTIGSGNASPGIDYTAPPSGSLTFAPGETFKSIDGIFILDDYTYEGTETFNIALTGVTNGQMGSVSTSTWTINNNDPDIYFYVFGEMIVEGNSGTTTATVEVVLYSPSGIYPVTPVSVSYGTAEDTTLHYGATGSGPTADYVPTSGNLIFSPGQTSKTFNVTINGDNVYEPREFFLVQLSNPVGVSFTEYSWQSSVVIDNDDNKPVINEFVVDHAGADNYEFIEIYGAPSANYADYRILIIENDSAENPGVIERVITVGTTNAQGFWRTPAFAPDSLENGSQILLLVRYFTGTVGQDLDADNNRQIDWPYPWGEDVDGVLLFNTAPGEDYGYDWNHVIGVGGASRIPNGTGNWLKNDFDGAGLPGFTGTPTAAEAQNTPGAANIQLTDVSPVISSNPANRNITYGQNTSFTASATSGSAPSVHWEVNTGSGFVDVVISGVYSVTSAATTTSNTSTLTLTNPPVSYSGYQYRAVFTLGSASTNTAAATLTVNKAAATVVLSNMTRTYTGGPLSPTATTTPAGLPITWTGAPQTTAGSYAVTAAVNDPNYQGSASGTFIIQMVYTLTVNQPATGGVIYIDPYQDTYASGSTVTLSVWTDIGYDFTGWTGDAAAFGTTSPITITMNSNKTVSANFVQLEYFVNLYTDPPASGSASFVGSMGPFHTGDTVTVSASGGDAYHFMYWSGNYIGSSSDNPFTFGMPPVDIDLTAHFEINTFMLTVNYDSTAGFVSPGGGIYNFGEQVWLNATPNAGYHFTSWGGDASGTSLSTSVIMDSNKTVTASFAIDFYQLYSGADGNGTVYQNGNPSSPQTYPYNTEVSLSAEPAPGWRFDHWSAGVASTSSALTTITMNTLGDRYVTAYFTNNPPVAEAGGPYSGNEGSSISVDASGSSDAGGSIASYEWDWDNNGTFDTSSPSPIASHTWPDNGSYTIRLRVTDGAGATATDTATVTVNNVAPAATFDKPAAVNEGSLINISLTGPTDPSSVDTAAGFQYAFDFGGGYSPFGSTNSASATAIDGPATVTVKAKIKDKDGGVREYTATVTVNNVAPIIYLSGNSLVNEGSTSTLNLGAVTDPGTDTITGYTINWGDGTSESFSAPIAASRTHIYGDGLTTPTITVDLTDEDGTFTAAGTKTITVYNVSPTISLAGNTTTDEGSSYSLTLGNVVDPGQDTVSAYSINWGDGTTENFTGSPNGLIKTHTYADGPNSFTIRVELTDEDGTFTGGTKGITVNNVAPTASADYIGITVEEGIAANNTGTFSDPGTDDVTISASIGIVNKAGSNSGTWSWSFGTSDGPTQSQTVTITANDGDGGITTTTFQLTVNNVAPAVTAPDSQTADEGTLKTFTLGSFTDPGADNPWAVDVDWGDGSTHTAFNLATTGVITGQSHTYADNGTYTVTVRVTDKDGASDARTFNVVVANVAPTVTAPANQTADEGTPKSFTLGSFTDPGTDNPWAVDVDWGDGSAHTTFNLAAIGAITGQSHTYADNGTYTVTVRVTDKDGASDARTFNVVVANVAPTVNAGADATIAWGNIFTQSGSFTDPGADIWVATVDYGDGTGVQPLTLTGKNFTLSHVYANDQIGNHTVTITVTDDDGGVGNDTLVVTVTKRDTTLVYTGDLSVEYSDLATVKATLTDDGGGMLQGTKLGDKTITFTVNIQDASGTTDTNGLAQTQITLAQIPGTSYTVVSNFAGDDWYNLSSDSDAFSIVPEKAIITFDSSNPVTKQVANPGDPGVILDSEEFIIYVTQEADGNLGTQNLTGTLSAKLVPVGGGGAIDLVLVELPDLSAFPGGGPAVYTFKGPAVSIPIETYTLEVTLSDPYYQAAQGEDVFVVYDPSLGFTTGGGWFYWPGTNDKTNFGYTMKYTKKGTSVQGSLLVIRHLSDGSGVIYRIKSNALDGLAITSTGTPGIATFSGKCTYIGPDSAVDLYGNLVNEGGRQFTVYVEDGDNPGDLPDKFWFSVLGGEFSLDDGDNKAETAEVQTIIGGNIVVPHAPSSGSGNSGALPTVASVNRESGKPGDTLTVVITGTNFTGATGVSFGAKITVVSFDVVSDTQITAIITIGSTAKTGTRDISVTTSGGTGTLPGGFTVNSG
jgi:uncharacterized repeat protein (TIGR02543 family)